MIYSKRLLKGTAKLFLEPINTTSWNEIKEGLFTEFGNKISSAEAHRLLQSTKKKNSESFRDYVYRMREIGSANSIEDESVIQYVVEGINDERRNKITLYGVKSFDELKVKLESYEQ